MKAVVLAGGKGSRLSPYTKILPKPLMPIDDMPILEILIYQMKRAGINEVILTVGHLADLLRSFFKDGSKYGLKIIYSYEKHPLGTAGPLSLLSELIDDTFLVLNGDVLTTLDMRELVEAHHQSGAIATIASHSRQVKVNLGVLQFNGDHKLIGYIEKPTYDFSVSMGIYVFEPDILRLIPYDKYLDFPELVLRLIGKGEHVWCYPFDGYWQDLGNPGEYEQAVHDFEEMRAQFLGQEAD